MRNGVDRIKSNSGVSFFCYFLQTGNYAHQYPGKFFEFPEM